MDDTYTTRRIFFSSLYEIVAHTGFILPKLFESADNLFCLFKYQEIFCLIFSKSQLVLRRSRPWRFMKIAVAVQLR